MEIPHVQDTHLLQAVDIEPGSRLRERSTAAARSRAFNPFCRPATFTLATRRFKSHSQGPYTASSKSLRSNTTSRCGVPYMQIIQMSIAVDHNGGFRVMGVFSEIARHDAC